MAESRSTAPHDAVELPGTAFLIATPAKDGAYTDGTGQKSGGTATYQVCEAGT